MKVYSKGVSRMKSSTLKEIAEKLNVSVSTVSRAVNQKEYVKEETRERVLRALEEYNYVPNEIARSLKMKSTKTIGIVVPDICETLFGMIIKGIDQAVSPKGYSIIVSDTNENKKNEEKYLNLLYQKRVDALVLATVDLRETKASEYIKSGIPVIFIDNIPALDVPVESVTIDNAKASKMVVEYLIGNGHRNIAVIGGSADETTGYERISGYRDTLKEHGIEVDEQLIRYGMYKEDDGFRCMQEFLDNRGRRAFSAVYVTSEMMTFGAMKAIRQYGLRIPEDISIVGFDVHDKAGLVYPSITTIREPEVLIGTKVGELLLERLGKAGEDMSRLETDNKVLLEPELQIGQSVRCIL
ncbi:LacI family DNA-binding transcriptional regulator [Diplocloster agilis]